MRVSGSVTGAWAYRAVWSTNWSLILPAAKIICKAINPKGRRWIHIDESNQHKSSGEFKNPDRPVFCSYVYDETWWPMFNVHLNYKPPSSWRVLYWSKGIPRQFTRLKRFRYLVVPGGGCCKGIILQGRQLKCRFSCGGTITLEKKRECKGIVYKCTHIEE